MTTRIKLMLILVLISSALFSQRWSKAYQLHGTGMERAWEIVKTNTGHVVVAGQFTDTLFSAGDTLICKGISDIFISVFDIEGNIIRTSAFGGHSEDVAITAAADSAGNIYFAGYFIDTAWFGSYEVISDGAWALYLCKLNLSGNVEWVRTASGSQSEIIYGIAVSGDGDVGFTGWFQDTVRFNDGTELISYGSSDIFAGMFNTNGELIWAKNAGCEGVDYGYKATFDALKNLYITGVASGLVQFDSLQMYIGSMYVACYNHSGNIMWVLPSDGGVSVNSITADTGGDGYVCGRYKHTGIFGQNVLNSYNQTDDAYIARFDKQGNWLWATSLGGNGSDKGRAITIASDGSALFTGSFTDTMPVLGFQLPSAGADDIFTGQISKTGNINWVNTAGMQYSDIATGITMLNDTLIALCGWYTQQTAFGYSFLESSPANINFFTAYNVLYSEMVKPLEIESKAYPNPANGRFHIPKIGKSMPLVYNMNAAQYFCPVVQDNCNEWIIDVSALPVGLYLVRCDYQIYKLIIAR